MGARGWLRATAFLNAAGPHPRGLFAASLCSRLAAGDSLLIRSILLTPASYVLPSFLLRHRFLN